MSAVERGPGAGDSGGPGTGGGPGRGPAAEPGGGRKARGRPRLTESDRARRRLESRKKYDVRRVYLGEAHGPWVDLRRRSGWSDAKLAAYLLGLERGQRAGRRGKPWEQIPKKPKRKKRRRRNVNCLRHAVIWYEDHRQRCPYEPRLAELDPSVGLYTTAVWQCERGHRYFQDLHSPLRPLSDSDGDSDDEEDEVLGLKQEEVPLPAAEPPPQPPPEPPQEPPPPPPAEDPDGGDVSAIIYEIPKEPESRRRSRRGRAPHPDPEELPEPIACPYAGCGQVYVALSSFQGRTQQCPQPGCGKRFYLANHLRRHMVIHSGVREFTCETCGKSFKRKNHLEVHRRTHTGETPLQCEVCGYRCRQRASLTWHMRRHGGPGLRPFPCERCGRCFERPEGLKFHALKSHPEPRGT
ncbi:zinc finger protein 653 isoform X10 [Aquila chrysaetos chrysaetos]|uniref:zinc finger protein 653 isoform X10 n=1 Tax=Aquila chrysaetos chrysaetos TaxID=223781 RepID=UPI001B7D3CAB|nr:zinc finger protein 653 isoform X10 [Aquila chrysaetos chrysaetos]